MAHRNNKTMITTLSLASILGIASLGQVHAESFSSYFADGIFWSTVGAAGQVDSKSAAIAKTSKTSITTAAPGTLVVLYSVTPSAELATAVDANHSLHLMANLMDPGEGASVDLSLVEVPVASISPARSIVKLSSSDAQGPSFTAGCAEAPVTKETGNFNFDFVNNVYYVQATLTWLADSEGKPKNPTAPMLRAVKIGIGAATMCAATN